MEREEGYVYFTDDFRVKRLDKLSLICEEQKEVTNPKTKETRVGWVQAGGYYGSWQAVYRFYSEHLESKVPLKGDLKSLVQALDGVQKSLDELLIQGQMMTALEAMPDLTLDERIRLAIHAHATRQPFSHDRMSMLNAAPVKSRVDTALGTEKMDSPKPKRRAKVEVAAPAGPEVVATIEEDDDWL